jgi:hypothetical protein
LAETQPNNEKHTEKLELGRLETLPQRLKKLSAWVKREPRGSEKLLGLFKRLRLVLGWTTRDVKQEFAEKRQNSYSMTKLLRRAIRVDDLAGNRDGFTAHRRIH